MGWRPDSNVDQGMGPLRYYFDNVPLRTMALLAARYLSGVSEERLHALEHFLDRPVTADQPAQQAG
jgi:hypothetical protein